MTDKRVRVWTYVQYEKVPAQKQSDPTCKCDHDCFNDCATCCEDYLIRGKIPRAELVGTNRFVLTPVASLPDLIEALEELADRWEAEQSDSDVDRAAGILSCEADLRTFIDTLAPGRKEMMTIDYTLKKGNHKSRDRAEEEGRPPMTRYLAITPEGRERLAELERWAREEIERCRAEKRHPTRGDLGYVANQIKRALSSQPSSGVLVEEEVIGDMLDAIGRISYEGEAGDIERFEEALHTLDDLLRAALHPEDSGKGAEDG